MTGMKLADDGDLEVIINKDSDGLIASGLQIGNTTLQNQRLLLWSAKGEIKEDLERGVGILNYLENTDYQSLSREIDKQFALDGMTVKSIDIDDSKLIIDADYES